jgi:hypothetical protein
MELDRKPDRRLSYPERWQAHADQPLTVFVPAAGCLVYVRPSSAIVGRLHETPSGWLADASPVDNGPLVEVCYEGNLYHAECLARFSERVRQAADRLITEYPTIARAWVPAEALVPVGTYVPRTHALAFTNLEALACWLDDEEVV